MGDLSSHKSKAGGAGRGSARRNSVRLDESQLNRYLDERENARTDAESAKASRAYLRWPFRVTSIEVRLKHPGQSEATIQAACHNLSAGGLGILHSAFIYPGTRCVVRLPAVDGRVVDVAGTVVRCQHTQGVVHDVGIRFQEPVEARDFVELDPFEGGFVLEKVDPDQLKGTVLFIGESALDQSVVRHFLRATHMALTTAATHEEIMARIVEGVDLILCDNDGRADDGAAIVERLRESGVTTPVIMLTAEKSAETREKLARARANAFLAKPLNQEMLFRAIAEFVVMDGAAAAFTSTLAPDHANVSMLDSYVAQVQAMSEELSGALSAGDMAKCRTLCLQIAGTAPVMGFERLAGMAQTAEVALSEAGNERAVAGALRALAGACKRVSARVAA